MPANPDRSTPSDGAAPASKARLLTPEQWERVERQPRYPGLLSFFYEVKFDPDYNNAFHADPIRTINLFGIDGDQAQEVFEASENNDNASGVTMLAELLTKYLVRELLGEDPPPKFW